MTGFAADNSANFYQLDDTLFSFSTTWDSQTATSLCYREEAESKLRQFTIVGITIICGHYCEVLR